MQTVTYNVTRDELKFQNKGSDIFSYDASGLKMEEGKTLRVGTDYIVADAKDVTHKYYVDGQLEAKESKIVVQQLEIRVTGNENALSDLSGMIVNKADQTTVAALQTDLSGLQTDLSGLQTDFSGLQSSVTANSNSIESIEINLSDLSGMLEGKESKMAVHELRIRVTDNENALSDLSGMIVNKADQTTVAALQTDLSGLQTDLSGLQTDFSGLQSSVTANSNSIESIEINLSDLSGMLEGKESKTAVQELRIRVTANESDLSDLSGMIVNKADQTTVAALQTEFSGLQTDLSGLQTKVTNVESSVLTIENQLIEKADRSELHSLSSGLAPKKACWVATTPGWIDGVHIKAIDAHDEHEVIVTTLGGDLLVIDNYTLASEDIHSPPDDSFLQEYEANARYRILIKDCDEKRLNGIYWPKSVTGSEWTLRRSSDLDNDPTISPTDDTAKDAINGAYTFILKGDINGDTGFVMTTDRPTINNQTGDDIEFTQFSKADDMTAAGSIDIVDRVIQLNPNVTIDQNLTVTNDATISGDVTVGRLLGLNGPLQVGSDMGVSGGLVVTGATQLDGLSCGALSGANATLSGDLTVTGSLLSGANGGALQVGTDLVVTGNLSGTALTCGDATLTGSLAVTGATQLDGLSCADLSGANAHLSGGLTVAGATQLVDLTCQNITQTSDARVKDSVASLGADECLRDISRLRPASYRLKQEFVDHVGGTRTEQLGLIAQELETVFPQAVRKSTTPKEVSADGVTVDAFRSIDYTALVAPLIGAVQALAQRVSALESEP